MRNTTTMKPLGSDIDIKIDDLDDILAFFNKEQDLIETKEREMYKDREVIEKLDKELNQRIEELNKATRVTILCLIF